MAKPKQRLQGKKKKINMSHRRADVDFEVRIAINRRKRQRKGQKENEIAIFLQATFNRGSSNSGKINIHSETYKREMGVAT